MVGHGPLKPGILVRIQAPQPSTLFIERPRRLIKSVRPISDSNRRLGQGAAWRNPQLCAEKPDKMKES